MKTIGKVVKVTDCREGNSNTVTPWVKGKLVIETLDKKPRKMTFEVNGEMAKKWLDKRSAGDLVYVKWFNLTAMRNRRVVTTRQVLEIAQIEFV